MREIRTSGSEGGAGQANAPSLPLSKRRMRGRHAFCSGTPQRSDRGCGELRGALPSAREAAPLQKGECVAATYSVAERLRVPRGRPWRPGRAAGPTPVGAGSRAASANEVTMIPTSESLSPPGTSYGRAAGGNCVAARRGGEQPEADPRSRTQVNPIRLPATASLLANGEACRGSGDPSGRHPSSKARAGVAGDGWGGNAGKVSWRTVESCPGRTPRQRRRAAVRAAVVALKRGNARGAKGGRKVERPRP